MRNTRSSRSVIPFCVPLCCLFLIGFVTSAKAQIVPSPSVCSPLNPVANPNIMGGVMCAQIYALCIAAECKEPDVPNKPTGKEGDTFTIGGGFADFDNIITHVNCECLTIIGNNIGQARCKKRAQKKDRIISTYSFQQNNDQFRVLTCDPADFPLSSLPLRYADCYNQPCKINPIDPTLATCNCPVFPALGKPFITRGGLCEQEACLAPNIFSAAPLGLFPDTNAAMACGIGLPAPPDEFACPSP